MFIWAGSSAAAIRSTPGTSRGQGTIGADYMHPDLYVDLVRAMERACFDYVMIEDGSFVPDAYKGTPEWYLHNAYTVPKHDPMPLVPLLAQAPAISASSPP